MNISLYYDHSNVTMDEIMSEKNTKETISAGDFKTHCLALMDNVKNKRQTIVITKRGIPVAKLMPADEISPSLFGWMKDTVVEQGSI